MKRDMDLIRLLLLYMENKTATEGILDRSITVDGYTETQIGLHLNMMADAGLLVFEASKTKSGRIIETYPFELSWKGFEYLDIIRDPEVWRESKLAAKKIGGASFDMLIAFAQATVMQLLGIK